ncbi:8-oxo-dGTP diphosphatase MutT [Bartonella sp. DGB1]|uniref:8-oxo-dGTP diphosphatase MutT n=1 Tax=Bartonella sp. DGB1 TaxID=3239807 RepID=UPI00352455FF
MKKIILVSSCALINPQRQILLTKRPEGKPMAGYWEFPGGKLEAQEMPEQAIIREIKEEININITADNLIPLTFASHAYKEFNLILFLYLCHNYTGTLKNNEGQEIAWVTMDNLSNYPMPAADINILPILKNYLEKL